MEIFDLAQLTASIDPVIVGICLITGALVKHETSTDNKHIPLIVTAEGLILVLINSFVIKSEPFTLGIILTGLLSGICSVGLHQSFRTWIENLSKE